MSKEFTTEVFKLNGKSIKGHKLELVISNFNKDTNEIDKVEVYTTFNRLNGLKVKVGIIGLEIKEDSININDRVENIKKDVLETILEVESKYVNTNKDYFM